MRAGPASAPPSGHSPDHAGAAHGIEAQPDAHYFDVMATVAETHWWYRARRAWVAQELGPRLRPGDTVLDVGTGTAETLDTLQRLGAGTVVGTDISAQALGFAARRRPRPAVLRSLATELPFPDACADALVSLEVLEHLDDDVAALEELARVVRPGGVLVLAVPAYEWAWSDHDVTLGHRRRYTAPRLRRVAEDAGLECVKVTYFHSWLAPIAFVLRKTPLRLLLRGDQEEASAVGPALNRAFTALTALERRVIRRATVPFGLSVLLVARRPAAAAATAGPATSPARG